MKKELGYYGWIAYLILLFGGVNYGLYALLKLDLIGSIFGTGFFGRILYLVVGVAAGYLIYLLVQHKDA